MLEASITEKKTLFRPPFYLEFIVRLITEMRSIFKKKIAKIRGSKSCLYLPTIARRLCVKPTVTQ